MMMTVRYYMGAQHHGSTRLLYRAKGYYNLIFQAFRHVSTLSVHHGHSNNQIGTRLFFPRSPCVGLVVLSVMRWRPDRAALTP